MRRFCSMFSQILPLLDRISFERRVKETNAEHHARGFKSWDHLVAMLFAQLGKAYSLREISMGLSACEGKLNHLGLCKAPARSTLSYANDKRPYELMEKVFYDLLGRVQAEYAQREPKRKFRFKNKMVSLDASIIDLCLEMYDWAKFRQRKGAVKLHLQLDHDGCLPTYALITEGAKHEINVAREMSFAPETIVVVDRGYVDYAWWGSLCEQKVYFVTRAKKNTAYEVVEELEVPKNRNVLSDQIIRLSGPDAKDACPHQLRRVKITDKETGKELVFLSNHLSFGATTIANIYKERWKIETFFRTLKQNFKIKTFLGTSANAVKTQIWTALIAMLLLQFLRMRAQFGWSMSNLVALLRMNLFVHRDLWAWLDEPFAAPPDLPEAAQLQLSFDA